MNLITAGFRRGERSIFAPDLTVITQIQDAVRIVLPVRTGRSRGRSGPDARPRRPRPDTPHSKKPYAKFLQIVLHAATDCHCVGSCVHACAGRRGGLHNCERVSHFLQDDLGTIETGRCLARPGQNQRGTGNHLHPRDRWPRDGDSVLQIGRSDRHTHRFYLGAEWHPTGNGFFHERELSWMADRIPRKAGGIEVGG